MCQCFVPHALLPTDNDCTGISYMVYGEITIVVGMVNASLALAS